MKIVAKATNPVLLIMEIKLVIRFIVLTFFYDSILQSTDECHRNTHYKVGFSLVNQMSLIPVLQNR